ncbi:cytochrome P460 family protein [Shewanella khirikhana]|uniref:cytochrome P460 family protein n=1 Tax=Shewanella khirikhana TaxID=1965282 RepID=UPI0030D3250F
MRAQKTSIKLLALLLALPLGTTASLAGDYYQLDKGELVRPSGYREWVYVGTPVTPNDMNNGKAAFPEHHNVYIDPKSWAHWKKTGNFRDGTILIKELVSVGAKSTVSGNGYFQGEYLGLEATIKSKKDFPNEPGNWAYFSFSSPDHKRLSKTAKAFPSAACNACHQTAAADDFVFTQFYPVLSQGKARGKLATGGLLDELNNQYQEPKPPTSGGQ